LSTRVPRDFILLILGRATGQAMEWRQLAAGLIITNTGTTTGQAWNGSTTGWAIV